MGETGTANILFGIMNMLYLRTFDLVLFAPSIYFYYFHVYCMCSCLIARNLLSGLKTCIEVSSYMREGGSSIPHKTVAASSFLEEHRKADTDYTVCAVTPFLLLFICLPLQLHFFYCCFRSRRCQQDQDYFVEGAERESLNILGNLLVIHQFGKELQMVKISLVSNIHHVDASLCVESNAPACITELAVRNIVGMLICFIRLMINDT